MANEAGFAMLEITNLLDFFNDHRKNYGDLLKALNVLGKDGKIEPVQKDIIGMYAIFVFQKINHTGDV